MGVCWKMDCVDARLRFAATPGCGQKLGRPSQKSGLGMAELSLQTPSAVIKWHSMKFNIPRGSREQVIWEMSALYRWKGERARDGLQRGRARAGAEIQGIHPDTTRDARFNGAAPARARRCVFWGSTVARC